MNPDIQVWLSVTSSVTQSLGAIATVIALIFLYVEIRQMAKQNEDLRKSIGSSTYQMLVQNEREMWDVLKDEEGFLSLFQGDLGLEIPPSWTDYTVRSLVTLASYGENLYFQYRHDALPMELWPGWEAYLRDMVNAECFRVIWPQIKHWYWFEFARFVDYLIQEGEPMRISEQVKTETRDAVATLHPQAQTDALATELKSRAENEPQQISANQAAWLRKLLNLVLTRQKP